MDFLQRNLFKEVVCRAFRHKGATPPYDNLQETEDCPDDENLSDIPSGEVAMHSGFLNKRLIKIQQDEPHAIDTSMETILPLYV